MAESSELGRWNTAQTARQQRVRSRGVCALGCLRLLCLAPTLCRWFDIAVWSMLHDGPPLAMQNQD
eukprot:5677054-Amphidinium_carterae.1